MIEKVKKFAAENPEFASTLLIVGYGVGCYTLGLFFGDGLGRSDATNRLSRVLDCLVSANPDLKVAMDEALKKVGKSSS